jgi:hypothetical protein
MQQKKQPFSKRNPPVTKSINTIPHPQYSNPRNPLQYEQRRHSTTTSPKPPSPSFYTRPPHVMNTHCSTSHDHSNAPSRPHPRLSPCTSGPSGRDGSGYIPAQLRSVGLHACILPNQTEPTQPRQQAYQPRATQAASRPTERNPARRP